MVVLEIEYTYAGLAWETVNDFADKIKRSCLTDPPSGVSVTIEEMTAGTTSFLYEGPSPTWSRLFLPDRCKWVDEVEVDHKRRRRVERGRNLTRAEDGLVVVLETSEWSQGPEIVNPRAVGGEAFGPSTKFHRRLEVSIKGVPDFVLRGLGIGRYTAVVASARQAEANLMRSEEQGGLLQDDDDDDDAKNSSAKLLGAPPLGAAASDHPSGGGGSGGGSTSVLGWPFCLRRRASVSRWVVAEGEAGRAAAKRWAFVALSWLYLSAIFSAVFLPMPPPPTTTTTTTASTSTASAPRP
mmetsp:Transcript_51595/g.117446  ORF Transcript_51595/g.117446 Transcript_51595/m.117446 type:complete len:296 (+) Transcript_51595:285-1172(+)